MNKIINLSINKQYSYIQSNKLSFFNYKFTKASTCSPFTRCFAIFNLNLIKKLKLNEHERYLISELIYHDLNTTYKKRQNKSIHVKHDKTYLQLLCFSLTALYILGTIRKFPLSEHFDHLSNINITQLLYKKNVHIGAPQSGNFSMFLAISLIHCCKYINLNYENKLNEWIDFHLKYVNKFGFWSLDKTMSHLQFQNGYHQHEIFNYLNIHHDKLENAKESVISLSDKNGRFAPYPGGGSCYDYDAISILTTNSDHHGNPYENTIKNTLRTILNDQNSDGGFCESHFVRPRSFNNILLFVNHIFSTCGKARYERFRSFISLQRSKHNRRIGDEHWTCGKYSRRWNESNLWDSFFRMSAIARIDIALHPENINSWGFVNYPGIGFHEKVKNT